MDQHCDVVIVGARLAGACAATHLARAGVDVVALDRSSFPSDQFSTHLLFPDGINEVRKMGALDGIQAHNPTRSLYLSLTIDGGTADEVRVFERWRNAGPIDYCMCVPRILQDVELVKAARAAGADVRERHKLVEVLWRGGRACGVRYADAEGRQHNLYARLVVGADGRRSSVAAQVGANTPYRASRNGRGLVFRYADDPLYGTRDGETIHQYRDGGSMAFVFPSAPAPRMLMLFMGAAEEAATALADPEAYWEAKLRQHPTLAKRVAGATNLSAVRGTGDTTGFFRASSGPGWALIGDAGHFKDPVLGQGQRDALWTGRRLAEVVVESLHDTRELDLAVRQWEQERDHECLHAYHFGNIETEPLPASPVLTEILRRQTQDGATTPNLGDLYGRARTMPQVLNTGRLVRGLADTLRHHRRNLDTPEAARRVVADIRTQIGVRRELAGKKFRPSAVVVGSDRPDPTPPAPVRPPARVLSDAPNVEPVPAPAAELKPKPKAPTTRRSSDPIPKTEPHVLTAETREEAAQ
ncbi:NAD(P)/FAD-dependent oxidoreductase [Nocardia sp. NPDC056611]|uniref:NAD(P)/FAD-dependent oxidoreductase n=1 Tax=Nocardia sp. NPDC056611 TaxID=3345877 RepID=UPI00366F1C1A